MTLYRFDSHKSPASPARRIWRWGDTVNQKLQKHEVEHQVSFGTAFILGVGLYFLWASGSLSLTLGAGYCNMFVGEVEKRRETSQNPEMADKANLWIKEVSHGKHRGIDGETQGGCRGLGGANLRLRL